MMTESFIVLQIIYDNVTDKSEESRACYNPHMSSVLILLVSKIWEVS